MTTKDEELLEHIKDLFAFVPPDRLKDRIITLLMQYLMKYELEVDRKLCEDIALFIEFLDRQKAAGIKKKSED